MTGASSSDCGVSSQHKYFERPSEEGVKGVAWGESLEEGREGAMAGVVCVGVVVAAGEAGVES